MYLFIYFAVTPRIKRALINLFFFFGFLWIWFVLFSSILLNKFYHSFYDVFHCRVLKRVKRTSSKFAALNWWSAWGWRPRWCCASGGRGGLGNRRRRGCWNLSFWPAYSKTLSFSRCPKIFTRISTT